MNIDWLDEQDFFEAMQAYRWSDRRGMDPAEVTAAFEAVKAFIRERCSADEDKG